MTVAVVFIVVASTIVLCADYIFRKNSRIVQPVGYAIAIVGIVCYGLAAFAPIATYFLISAL